MLLFKSGRYCEDHVDQRNVMAIGLHENHLIPTRRYQDSGLYFLD